MTVLITGGSKGIGLALAERFAQQDSDLVLVAREKDALMRAAEQLRERYTISVTAISADLTKHAAPGLIRKELAAKGISISGLVNNAGIGHRGSLKDTPTHRILALNVDALTGLTKMFLPDIERASGFVINVSSVAGLVPIPQMSVYAASKAYVVSFSESLSSETNARVLCICPGPVDTAFHDIAGSVSLRKGARSADQVARETMRALRRKSIVYVTDPQLRWMLRLTGWMPRSWVRSLVKAMDRD
jgi:uncharacterized protein